MTDSETQTFVARLHRDKIALYEQVHDGMTREHAMGNRKVYDRLDIYRLDDLLIMLVDRKPVPSAPPTEEDAERGRQWHATLAECFAEPWRLADPIFSLATAGTGER